MSIFKKIVTYCSENNLTIASFEKKCGIGNGVVDDWNPEKEKHTNPSLSTLKKISENTGIALSDWFGE